jgi:hypothetical protein
MHQRWHSGLAFLLVALAAVAGAYLARQVVGPIEPQLPRLDVAASLQDVFSGIDINSLIPRRNPAQTPGPEGDLGEAGLAAVPSPEPIIEPGPAQPIAGVPDVTPAADAASASGGEATPVPAEAIPTQAPPTPTPTEPSANSAANVPFAMAGAVRNSSDGCPGPSIRGTVRDAAGSPLPGIRLWRYDQWGNEQVVETKSGAEDAGQYDFPLGDTPNVHYVQVVDAGGAIVSPVIEIQHRQGEAPDANCHWIDWVQR